MTTFVHLLLLLSIDHGVKKLRVLKFRLKGKKHEFIHFQDEEPSRLTAAPEETPPPAPCSIGDDNSPYQEVLTPLTPTPHPSVYQTPVCDMTL